MQGPNTLLHRLSHRFSSRDEPIYLGTVSAATIGGATGVLASHPLDVIRLRQSASATPLPAMETLRVVLREVGLRGMFSGIVSPMTTLGFWKGVTLGTQRHVLNMLAPDRKPTPAEVLFASCAGGVTGGVVVSPGEYLKTRAACAGSTVMQELRSVNALELREISRSAKLLASRDFVSTGGMLLLYDSLMREFGARKWDHYTSVAIASAIAGPFAWLICYPIEVLRIQTQQHATLPRDVVPAFRHLLKTHGWSLAFWYRGLPMAMVRGAFQLPPTLIVFEALVDPKHKTKYD